MVTKNRQNFYPFGTSFYHVHSIFFHSSFKCSFFSPPKHKGNMPVYTQWNTDRGTEIVGVCCLYDSDD